MLVGASHAGKTSLRKYFQNKNAPQKEILCRKMTDGVDFVDVQFPNSEIIFHVGDFGGHRFEQWQRGGILCKHTN